MRRALSLGFLTLAAMIVAGCRARTTHGPLEVSIIGPALDAPLPRGPLPAPRAALTAMTSLGLVRFDREGQVIPAAAARWAILDEGRDYIFRIDDTGGITAPVIARRLRAVIRPAARDPLHALLAPIVSVDAVTSTVVEVRLAQPFPDLLLLLARAEFALGVPGPMRVAQQTPRAARLVSAPGEVPRPYGVQLHADRAGLAVVRFKQGLVDAVLGGTLATLPVAQAGDPPRGALHFDPASGLLGFALRDAAGPAADPVVRAALALALDRDRLVAAMGVPGMAKATTLAGSTVEQPLADRLVAARTLLAQRPAGPVPELRVALPDGPGTRLLFALAAQDWARIGITARAVPQDAPADLLLIDRVAAPGTLAALACAASAGCDPRDRLALISPPYIPVSAPVRWSLVGKRLDRFTENNLAAHPLDQLRTRR